MKSIIAKEFFNSEEVSWLYGINKDTIMVLAKKGIINKYAFDRRVYYNRSEIISYLISRKKNQSQSN
jgi:hypothetical protein